MYYGKKKNIWKETGLFGYFSIIWIYWIYEFIALMYVKPLVVINTFTQKNIFCNMQTNQRFNCTQPR